MIYQLINGCSFDCSFNRCLIPIYVDSESGKIIDEFYAKSYAGSDLINSIDVSDCFVVPGFIDTHIHGAYNFDCSDASIESISKIASSLPTFGVSAFCPTTMTMSREDIESTFKSTDEAITKSKPTDATILGIHLEGPFLNSKMCGVQDASFCMNPMEGAKFIDNLLIKYPGLLLEVDLAPELETSLEFISRYKNDFVISLAHSLCNYEQASKAFICGARRITHAFNAMSGIEKRAPGIVGAAFDQDFVFCELICDGYHVDKTIIRMLFKAFGSKRIVVVSDSMRGSGMPDGEYMLYTSLVTTRNGRTYYGKDERLAGSVTNLAKECENLISYGIPVEQVIESLTITPLRSLKLSYEQTGLGLVTPGARASINVINSKGELLLVFANGILLHDYRQEREVGNER
ncbi:MAG: N-acetylglucosamine-6-phosphate deacetylase [Saccharofermentanaceae bacterium]|jgi:N-acetylglucosamine-6-phosphate deacetylase|nr:N-acetylglucosamine-6-phosphate deacetylase [Clostridia bacterium]NLX68274.1 N-acetylglucosamine-6-phosphate deacetylase [Clostridiaceae bacterium]HOO49177.1 N-acetylglucosamine-6-phosphate deacetylase [Saccharofermentans sp.]HPJ82117.1 N-acetylglucosamine-6-phosphate deacetylase [Saccharofermentans sp.]HPQ32418.1 N-acetylglucosamine-6-phosphate deacetylase [Saccharofermentans sp.]